MSEKTQHTPGPWETPGTDDGDRVISASIKGKRHTLAHVYGGDDPKLNVHTAATRDANARLIAAAPEMLKALRVLALIGDDGVLARIESDKLAWTALNAVRGIARAAISKAEGGAH
jgi:hypothetical protein